MFGRLKSLILGGAAGSAPVPPSQHEANNIVVQSPQPVDRVMKRTKRKRDSLHSDKNNDTGGQDVTIADQPPVCDDEPPQKKARSDDHNDAMLTLISDATTTTPHNTDDGNVRRRKRRRSFGSDADDTPFKRRKKAWEDLIARPFLDDGQSHDDESANDVRCVKEDVTRPDPDGFVPLAFDDADPSSSTNSRPGNDLDVVAGSLAAGLANLAQQYGNSAASPTSGLQRNTDFKPSRRHRRTTKKYVKHTSSGADAHTGCADEKLLGAGLWSGSADIPGSLQRELGMEDRIELPKRKPRRVRRGLLLSKELSLSERRSLAETAD